MRINDQKITPELAAQADLVFFPKSLEEAVFIQRKLFDMGFTWGSGTYEFENGSTDLISADTRLLEGLQLDREKGGLFAHPDKDALNDGLLCTVEQLAKDFVSPHQQLLNAFNDVSRRLAALEEQINPRVLEKKNLGGPKK